jgi:hypothetical protein
VKAGNRAGCYFASALGSELLDPRLRLGEIFDQPIGTSLFEPPRLPKCFEPDAD